MHYAYEPFPGVIPPTAMTEQTPVPAPTLRLPEAYQAAVVALAQLTPEARQAILDALDSVPAFYSQKEVTAHVATTTGVAVPIALAVLGVASSTISAVRQTGADVARYAAEEAGRSSHDDVDVEQLAGFLRALTDRKGVLDVGTEVTRLLYDHANLYNKAEVLTDFRPFWGHDADGIQSGVICHTLRVTVLDARSEQLDFYVALDAGDLVALRGELDRAISKAQILKKALGGLQIHISDE